MSMAATSLPHRRLDSGELVKVTCRLAARVGCGTPVFHSRVRFGPTGPSDRSKHGDDLVFSVDRYDTLEEPL